jgi:hypothetical protein
MRLLPLPQAVANAEKAYKSRESERAANIAEVHRLTAAGVSAMAISTLLGMSERNVQRLRGEALPSRGWYEFDKGTRRQSKLERTADDVINLACRIRDEDPELVYRSLENLATPELLEVAMIALAAIPVHVTKDEIFGWVEEVSS